MQLQGAPLGARGEASGHRVGEPHRFTPAVSWSARLALILALALPCSALAGGPQRLWGELFSIENYLEIPSGGLPPSLTSDH